MTYSASLKSLRYSAFLFLLLLAVSQKAKAQVDSAKVETTVKLERGRVNADQEDVNPEPELPPEIHSPRKATLMSTALPGLGQIYNKKIWKVPIIYGGFAAAGYYLNDNLTKINLYKDGYSAATDTDPNTENTTGFSVQQLDELIDQYKGWRDLSYIAIVAIYVLNIIDANVDAHLFNFEVNEDISMNISPYMSPMASAGAGLTLTLKW